MGGWIAPEPRRLRSPSGCASCSSEPVRIPSCSFSATLSLQFSRSPDLLVQSPPLSRVERHRTYPCRGAGVVSPLPENLSLGRHPKPALGRHLKTGRRE